MEESQAAAVYVPWSTLKNAIDGFTQGVPNVIDRSIFPGLSGGVQSQLLAGLKFLGLINDDNRPTADLHELAVPDESARKEKLKQILQQRYAALFALDLMKTTPNELSMTMGSAYAVNGDTREKAIRFFLSAVGYVGIPVSRLFAPMGGGNGGSPGAGKPRKRPAQRTKPAAPASEDDPPPPSTQAGPQRTVNLQSGGTLTLRATVDFFSLSQDDRNFVFGLIDKMDQYEKGTDLV